MKELLEVNEDLAVMRPSPFNSFEDGPEQEITEDLFQVGRFIKVQE